MLWSGNEERNALICVDLQFVFSNLIGLINTQYFEARSIGELVHFFCDMQLCFSFEAVVLQEL